MTEISDDWEANRPDRELSTGDLVVEAMRRWQHRSEPTQIDALLGTTMSYRELLVQTVHAAEGFKAMGLKPKDVVAVVSRNCHEVVPALFGAVCAGLSVACVVPSGNLAEMQHALNLTKPKLVISERDRVQGAMDAYPGGKHVVLSGDPPEGADTFLEVLRKGEAAEPRPDPDTYRAVDVGDRSQHAPFILFSSGTTGLPKAVMLRDSGWTAFLAWSSHLGQSSHEMFLVSSPLCWISGVHQYLWTLKYGATRVLTSASDPVSILSAIDKFKITSWLSAPPILFAVSSAYKNKYKNLYDISSLERIFLGGSSTSADVHAMLQQDLNCNIIQGYGSTECGAVFGLSSKLAPPGAMGTLVEGIEARLVDIDTGKDIPEHVKHAVGELRVRSKYLMLGYYNNPEATEEAFDEHGFFKTGDLVYEDEDGYFYFVDRIKEMMKYMNYQIAPAEVEQVLLQHPGVKDACVLGRVSPAHGELPTAFVSRADNKAGEALTEAELQDTVAEQLTDYKRLRGGVIFLDELPKTVAGKIERRSLKDMLKNM